MKKFKDKLIDFLKNRAFVFVKENIIEYFLLILPFFLMDVFIRIKALKIDYDRKGVLQASILFSVVFVTFMVCISKYLKGWIGKAVYILFYGISLFMFLTNMIYYTLTGYFFKFSLMFMASEGSAYIGDTIKSTDKSIWIMAVLIIVTGVIAIAKFKRSEKYNVKGIILVAIVFAAGQIFIPNVLGKGNANLKWDSFRKPANVYKEFNDANKNIKICGFFKYTERDFVKTFFKGKAKKDPDEINFLKDCYKDEKIHQNNPYTGMFKNKNIIFLQLEGIDTWLLTKEDMPNLYGLMENSLTFNEHYSYYNGGGSTFNSEFAINTGLITPISYNQNAYTFSSNTFKDTLPMLFKDEGYEVYAYHMNSKEYYNRGLNYKAWGYDDYFGLKDEVEYDEDDYVYEMDTELFDNETFRELFFNPPKPERKDGIKLNGRFVKYLISYTPHTPFVTNKGVGEYLAKKVYGDNIPDMDEEEVARMMATETDRMVGQLIDGLKEHNLYEDTVIVAYADHYLYTINDKSVLDKYKTTSDNRINNTPFFIWSNDIRDCLLRTGVDNEKLQTVSQKVNSQLDIMPTILNMFGIKYDENKYIGNDIMDDNYSGYVFFDDYSWYDGSVYFDGSAGEKVGDNPNSNGNSMENTNGSITKSIKKNDLTLKYNWYKMEMSKE